MAAATAGGAAFSVFGMLEGVDQGAFERLSVVTVGLVAKDPRISEKNDLVPLFDLLGEQLTLNASLALAALVADTARLDAGPAQVTSTLEENGLVSPSKTGFVGRLFAEKKAAVRLGLGLTLGASMRRFVDIDWRLDYVVRSSDASQKVVPVYYVKLLVDSPGNEEDSVEMSLSVEQMQDFLMTVRDANHQAGRLGSKSMSSST